MRCVTNKLTQTHSDDLTKIAGAKTNMQAGVHVFTTLTYKLTLNHGPGLVICERGKVKVISKFIYAGEWMEMVAKHK